MGGKFVRGGGCRTGGTGSRDARVLCVRVAVEITQFLFLCRRRIVGIKAVSIHGCCGLMLSVLCRIGLLCHFNAPKHTNALVYAP